MDGIHRANTARLICFLLKQTMQILRKWSPPASCTSISLVGITPIYPEFALPQFDRINPSSFTCTVWRNYGKITYFVLNPKGTTNMLKPHCKERSVPWPGTYWLVGTQFFAYLPKVALGAAGTVSPSGCCPVPIAATCFTSDNCFHTTHWCCPHN